MADGPQTDQAGLSGLVSRLAPVGRRLLGRQARLQRATGRQLSEAVASRHEPPEPARAARRLAPVRLVTRSAAPGVGAPAAPAPAPAPAPSPAAEGGWEASSSQSTILPGMSDWAAEWMFGDETAAVQAAHPRMGGAHLKPPTPEERRLSRIKRGGPETARAARILEGDEQAPAGRTPEEQP